jgi:hypothetical protein
MPVKLLASPKAHLEMGKEVSEAYQQLTKDLVQAHRDYKLKERKNEKDKLIHGTISEQKQAELEGGKRLFEKLFAAVSSLSEATGGDMPVLEEDKDDGDSGKASFIICMLTLLLMPLAGLHICVGLDFVTPLVVIFFK